MKAKVVRKGVFLAAYRRLRRDLAGLPERCPDTAVYLAGYLLECRLKVRVCEQRQVDRLDEANAQINNEETAAGRRSVDLLGRDGHNLELLWRLAGLASRSGAWSAQLKEACRWDVAWRYQVDSGYRGNPRAAAGFLATIEALCECVEQREGVR